MNYYDTVKEKIADYIVREPVEETEEVISAYTLFSALESYNKRIRHTREKGKALVDKLNTIYPPRVVQKKGKLFKKKIKLGYFDGIKYNINDNSSTIALANRRGYIYVHKDYDNSDIYSSYNNALDEEAYNECINDIGDIFDELEYFGMMFANERKSNGHKNSECGSFDICNKIHCEGFDIETKFNSFAINFDYDISLNKDFDPKGNSNMHYYDQENSLNQVIEENKEAILRNTPVNIGDLSYMFCMLVLDYMSREKRNKNKKEIDEIKVYEKNKTN